MKRLSILLALLLGVLLAAPADAARRFAFHGSGYGHGLGMSQYGALGLARAGWPAGRIVRHYYTGTRVGRRPPPGSAIRVGLAQSFHEIRLAAQGGPFVFKLSTGRVIERVPAGAARRVRIVGGRYRILKPSGRLVGGQSWGGSARDLLAVRDGGRILVSIWGHVLGRGFLRFDIIGSQRAHLVGVMPVEAYLLGISEVPSEWHHVALQAQAIASRSYAYWRLAGGGQSGCSCDIYATTWDQVYAGWDKEAGPSGARWVRAVRDTKRRVVTYQGEFIYTVFGSSSGGHTEAMQNVWPAASPKPWLKGVCDPRDDVPENQNTTWSERFSAAYVTQALRPYTGDIGRVRRFTRFDLGVSGRVTRVRVVGGQGAAVVEGWDIRQSLNLPDTRFSVNRNLNITGRIRDQYDRNGCRPGRAIAPRRSLRRGAFQRFQRGRIYVNETANRVVWVRGAVLRRYVRLGAHTSGLRLPLRWDRIADGTKGWFEGGTIACTPTCRVRYG